MSNIEEPPSKITKYEMESQYLEGEVMEEGQEEWLSEGILTDEDYTVADTSQETASSQENSTENIEEMKMSNSEEYSQTFTEPQVYNVTVTDYTHLPDVSQDYDQTSQEHDQSNQEYDQSGQVIDSSMQEYDQTSQEIDQSGQSNIEQAKGQTVHVASVEETLDNLEKSDRHNQFQSDLPPDLDEYLIRKTCVRRPAVEDKDSDVDKSAQDSDDGHDTDELLRMLGDKDDDSEKETKDKEIDDDATDCEDDEYIFKGNASKVLQVAAAASKVLQKTPTKAVPEDDDITDASSDENEPLKKYAPNKTEAQTKRNFVLKKMPQPNRSLIKKTITYESKPAPQQRPLRTYQTRNKSLLKTNSEKVDTANALKSVKNNDQITVKRADDRNLIISQKRNENSSQSRKEVISQSRNQVTSQSSNQVTSEILNEVKCPKSIKVLSQIRTKIISQNRNQPASQNTNQVASPNTNQAVSEKRNQVAIQNTKQVVSQNRNQVVSQNRNQVVSQNRNQVVSQNRNQVVSQNRNQVASPSKNQVASSNTNQVASQKPNQVANQSTNQVVSQKRNQVANKNTNQVASQKSNQVVNQNTNQVASNNRNPVANQNTNQGVSAKPNQVASPNKNQVTTQNQTQVASQRNEVSNPKGGGNVKKNDMKVNEKLKDKKPPEPDQETKEPEAMDEDVFEIIKDRVKPKQEQKIMRPELMDEDVMSDCESDSDANSFYDELPSSDSDTPDDWFTLDIRAERAADYLPLLGDQAYALLSSEKEAVSGVIKSLCQSMAVLNEQVSQQAKELQQASNNLGLLKSTLKHL